MKIKDVVKFQNTTYRIIDISDKKAFVVDCNKKSVPKWIDLEMLLEMSINVQSKFTQKILKRLL